MSAILTADIAAISADSLLTADGFIGPLEWTDDAPAAVDWPTPDAAALEWP